VTASPNLDLVRSIYADWERSDFSRTEWADREIEFVFADGPDPGSWKGVTAMVEAWRNFASAWEGYRMEADEYRELGDGRIIVFAHTGGERGKTSGLELGQHGGTGGAMVFHVSAGKVTRLVGYFDRHRALADLGLAPEGGSPDS
jgi:ketosteroid isomerase-like protein